MINKNREKNNFSLKVKGEVTTIRSFNAPKHLTALFKNIDLDVLVHWYTIKL